MLNLNKIYSVKSNASRDLKKAIERGIVTGEDLEIRKVDGGFQIVKIVIEKPVAVTEFADVVVETPEIVSEYAAQPIPPKKERPASSTTPRKATKPGELPETQLAALNALFGAKSLADKADNERAGVWFPFADIHESSRPHGLSKSSMAGITKGLVSRGLLLTAWGDDYIGKHIVAACITPAGIAALQEVAA
jgi:hypothetical protein